MNEKAVTPACAAGAKNEQENGQGFILIAVLWVSALLALFALYYSSAARVEGLQALNIEKRLNDFSLLQSGLDWGLHEYRKFAQNKSLLTDKEQLERQSGQTLDLKYPRQEPYTMSAGNRTVAVQITDLSGKLSVNAVDENLLRDVLSACGMQQGADRTGVVNSILDWIDTDNLHRQEGAEEDYYVSLDPPYQPKNGPLQSIEELLLIKGIDRELFEGTVDRPGLKDFLTVHGEQTSMDINSAAAQAFLIIDDLPRDVVEDIVAYRRQKRIQKLTDLVDIVPQRHFGQLEQYFAVQSSSFIHIAASMVTDQGDLGHSLSTCYQLGGQ